jgi:tetratricopeptide (TPR) repeat protein
MTLGLEYLSENSFATGRWQDTLDFAEQEHKIADQIGEQNRLAWIQLNRTWAYRGLGKLSKAEQEGLKGLKLADRVSDVRASLLIQSRLSYTLTDMGRFAEAEKNTSDGLINSANIDHIYIMGLSKVSRAYYHIRNQEWQPALELANSINDSLIKSDALWLQQSIDPVHALALWGIGEYDIATQLASDTYQRALISRAVGTQAEILQIWAQVLFSQEKYDDALEKANAAFEVAQQENYRLIMGLSNYWKAKILLAQKKTPEAKKAAQEALELFEYCGAQPDIDRTQNLINTL